MILIFCVSPNSKVEVKAEPSEGLDEHKESPQVEALKMKIKQLESASEENKLKCLICMVGFANILCRKF